MGQVGECKNKLSNTITYPLITSYMLWFNKKLHFLKILVNGEVSFLSNSNFDGQVQDIDTRIGIWSSLYLEKRYSVIPSYTLNG